MEPEAKLTYAQVEYLGEILITGLFPPGAHWSTSGGLVQHLSVRDGRLVLDAWAEEHARKSDLWRDATFCVEAGFSFDRLLGSRRRWISFTHPAGPQVILRRASKTRFVTWTSWGRKMTKNAAADLKKVIGEVLDLPSTP